MTKAQMSDAVSEVVSYCWAHAEGSKEEEMVQWMAEHLSTALRAKYVLPDHGRRIIIDGTAGKQGSLRVTRTAA